MGCDKDVLPGADPDDTVSIHAPAWGATSGSLKYHFTDFQFQSTHPRGVRRSNLSSPDTPMLFQSTHPRGVRLSAKGVMRGAPTSFNPRTRVGCDENPLDTVTTVLCFNPRTRVGCDR